MPVFSVTWHFSMCVQFLPNQVNPWYVHPIEDYAGLLGAEQNFDILGL